MRPDQTVCAADNWCVCSHYSADIKGLKLSLFKTYERPLIGPAKFPEHVIRTLWQHAEADGMIFGPDKETCAANAREYLLERGFLKHYSRNLLEFHSNRTFRKRTGFDNIHEMRGKKDVLWDTKMRNGKRTGELKRLFSRT